MCGVRSKLPSSKVTCTTGSHLVELFRTSLGSCKKIQPCTIWTKTTGEELLASSSSSMEAGKHQPGPSVTLPRKGNSRSSARRNNFMLSKTSYNCIKIDLKLKPHVLEKEGTLSKQANQLRIILNQFLFCQPEHYSAWRYFWWSGFIRNIWKPNGQNLQ